MMEIIMSLVKTKPASRSLTIRAAIIAVIASLLPLFGIRIAPDALPTLENIVSGIAAAIAIYGRIRAHTFIQFGR
jgi:hypothetical protein